MPVRLALVLVVTVALAGAPARAGIEPWILTADVKTYSCRELLALDEPRQNLALTYFSGYVDGQRSLVQFDLKAKGAVIEKVMEHCRGDAAGSVLEAFLRLTP
jgi:hypothetical protein